MLLLVSTSIRGQTAAPATPQVPAGSVDAGKEAQSLRWPARLGERSRDDGIERGVIIQSPRAFKQARGLARQSAMIATLPPLHQFAGNLDKANKSISLDPSGQGLLVLEPLAEGEPESRAYATGASMWFSFVSGREAHRDGADPAWVVDQTWFGWYEPTKGPPVATVAFFPGMLGTPEPVVEGLIARLRDEGFAVLRCLTHPARYCAKGEVEIDFLAPEAGLRLAAAELDQRVAEYAYAVQAAWRHVEAAHPEVRSLPRAAVGFSGGAIALPTIVALEPDRYSAAVLVAGGVNGLAIAERSNYADMLDAYRVKWMDGRVGGEGLPTRAQRADACARYPEFSSLDGVHTARALHGKEVLVLHATKDEAVPSDLGEAFWIALGRPERWTYPLSHEGIFAVLMLQHGRTAGWLKGALSVSTE